MLACNLNPHPLNILDFGQICTSLFIDQLHFKDNASDCLFVTFKYLFRYMHEGKSYFSDDFNGISKKTKHNNLKHERYQINWKRRLYFGFI